MDNIYTILGKFGLEIPEDKKKEFNSELNKNYKTVAEFDNLKTQKDALQTKYDTDIKQRDDDLTKLQTQLKESGIESDKLQATIKELEDLKANYTADKDKYQAELTKQRYEYLVKDKANSLNFTSNSAKKAFISEAIAKNLTVDGDNLLGFDDFVEAYKKSDADAFKSTEGKAHFSTRHEEGTVEEGGTETTEMPFIW